jgi:hypothetical protein
MYNESWMPAPGVAAPTAPVHNEVPGAQPNPDPAPQTNLSYTQLLQMLRNTNVRR